MINIVLHEAYLVHNYYCISHLQISQAVVPIVLWIAALVDYRKAKSAVQPFRDQLNQAEEMLSTAQEVYVTMRHNMITTKDDLEIQHVQHKGAVKIFKAIKEDLQVQLPANVKYMYM